MGWEGWVFHLATTESPIMYHTPPGWPVQDLTGLDDARRKR
jgi:hypothetical protein